MALTQTDLDTLDAAIAKGELEVEYNGRRVKYKSAKDLMVARDHVNNVLSAATSAFQRRSQFQYRFTTARGD